MKKLIVSLLTVIFLLVFFSSCKKNASLEFNKVDYTRVLLSSHPSDSAKGYCKVDIQFLYPIAGDNADALKKIQQQLIVYAFDSTYLKYDAKKAAETFTKTTFDAYTKLITSNNDSNLVYVQKNEEWILNTLILFNDMGILSYELSRFSQIGRNYSYENTQYLVFNLKTGEKLTERDIFEDGFEPKLSDLLKKQIMLDNGFESEEQMINNGYFFAENIQPNGNFSITEEGISYVFNANEIAVLSLGITEVLIPFKHIKSVLKEDSPISKLIK